MKIVRVVNEYDSTESQISVESISANGVRLLRNAGIPTAVVRAVSGLERRAVVDAPFAASWLGWHRGQCPAYGSTPEIAVRKLAAGRLAE